MGVRDAIRRRVTGNHHEFQATDKELDQNPPAKLTDAEIAEALRR